MMMLKKNIAATWAAHGVTLLVGFVLVPIVLNVMGEESYGAWVLLNSIAGYSGLLYFGFGPTVCRFVTNCRARGEWERVNQVVSSVVVIYAAASSLVLLLAIGLALAAPGIDKWGSVPILDVQIAVLILGLNMGVGMVGSVYGGVLHAANRIDLYSGVQGMLALVRLALTVCLLQERHGLVLLAGIFLAITVLENTCMAALAYREVRTLSVRPRFVTRPVIRECFGFSVFNAIRLFSEQLIYLTDTIVVGFVLGTRAVVPYYIASRLAQMIHTPLERIGEVVLPAAGDMHARGQQQQLRQLLLSGMGLGLMLAGGFWIGGVYFGDRLVFNWMGRHFDETQLVLTILVGAQIVAQPMIVLRQVLLAMGIVRAPALMYLAQALGNLILSLILVQEYGIVGVAWGTLIPMVLIDLFVMLPYGMRTIGVSLGALISRAVVPQCFPLVALWIYSEAASRADLPGGWGPLIAVTIGGGAVLVGTSLLGNFITRRHDASRIRPISSSATESPA